MHTLNSFRLFIVCLLAVVAHVSVAAGPFEIKDRVGFNPLLDTAADQIQTDVNTGFLSSDKTDAFVSSMARAATSGTSGLIADRVSRPSIALFGAGVQLGYQGDLSKLKASGTNALPAVGAGGQASLLVGLPGSLLQVDALKDFNFYVSGGALSFAQSGVAFKMFNLGVNAAYQVVPELGLSVLAKWGGVQVLSGLNYFSGSVGYGGHVKQEATPMSVDMDIDVRLDTSNFYIPLEASTSIQLFYILNFYAGGALDFNFGKVNFAGTSSGPVDTGVPGTSATASLNLDALPAGSISKTVLRGFVGTEFSMWAARIGAVYTVLSNSSKSASMFLKLAL